MFTPYRISKYTRHEPYRTRYGEHPGSYAELCSKCGYPLGEHNSMNKCPGETPYYHIPKMSKELYPKVININIIIL